MAMTWYHDAIVRWFEAPSGASNGDFYTAIAIAIVFMVANAVGR